MKNYSTLILRLGMCFVFFWFSINQFMHPVDWVGFLPAWTGSLPVSQLQFVYLNAFFEITFGVLLLLGFYTRFVSLLLSLHLFAIAFSLGLGDAIGVRDIGLAIATLAICVAGMDRWTLDYYFSNKIVQTM